MTSESHKRLDDRSYLVGAEVAVVDAMIRTAKKKPYFHLDGYMNRWWLVEDSVRIHQILRSDEDRHLHDHPFDYTSIILRGAYIEETIDGARIEYGQGSVLTRKAGDFHRLTLPYGEVWSLFMIGHWKQVWGFMTENGKVPWRDYLSPEYAAQYEKHNRHASERK